MPRCALKLDLVKANDFVAWSFIFDVMKVMDFHRLFIRRVRHCVTSAMFSVNISGASEGYFSGKRG